MGALSDAGIRPSVRPSVHLLRVPQNGAFYGYGYTNRKPHAGSHSHCQRGRTATGKNRNNTALAGVPHGHIFNNVS